MKLFEVKREGKEPMVICNPADGFADLCVCRDGGNCILAKQAGLRGIDLKCIEVRKRKQGNGEELCQPFAYWDVIQRARGILTNRMKDQLRAVRLLVIG